MEKSQKLYKQQIVKITLFQNHYIGLRNKEINF